MKRNEKAITLIALVVTIIVLLILAGVTIAMVLGQDGIFKKAQTAAEKTDETQEIEQVRVAVLEAKTNYITGDKSKSFEEELKESINKIYPGADVKKKGTGENIIYTITLPNGNEYEVDAQGKVTKKEPVKPVDPTEVWYKIEETTLYLSKNDLGGYTKNTSTGKPLWAGTSSSNPSPITKVIIENEIAPTSTFSWFFYCTSLTELGSRINGEYVPNNLRNLNTCNVTSMNLMFLSCNSLINLDLSSFDTSNVTNMNGMFSSCSNLTSLDLSNFDTSNVTNMSSMFSSCSSLTSLDLSNFDTSKVTNMSRMFSSCSSLISLDLSSFDTPNVINMNSMFSSCSSLTSLALSSFNTQKVTNTSSMFLSCSNLTSLDLSNFDTSKVTNMSSMFYGCSSLTSLDLSSFNTQKVTSMGTMFYECRSLTSLDLSSFDTPNVTNMSSMFTRVQCPVLVSLKWTLTESDTNYSGTFQYV